MVYVFLFDYGHNLRIVRLQLGQLVTLECMWSTRHPRGSACLLHMKTGVPVEWFPLGLGSVMDEILHVSYMYRL